MGNSNGGGGIFAPKKTPKELLRENKRLVNRAVRELEREKKSLEKNEKKLVADIKKAAKEGQMGSVKIMAKDLVRTRTYKTKFINMKSQLQAVGLRLEMAKSTEAMTAALQGTASAMKKMNKAVNVSKLQEILMEFEKQNEISELQGEMMEDAMDDAMETEDGAEEEDKIVDQVLAELGLDAVNQIQEAPVGAAGAEVAAPAASDPAVNDLEARLNNLRNG